MTLPVVDRLWERASRRVVSSSITERYGSPINALHAPPIEPDLHEKPDAICLQGPFEGFPDLRQVLIVIGVGSVEEWFREGTTYLRTIGITGNGFEKRKAWLRGQVREVWPEVLWIEEIGC